MVFRHNGRVETRKGQSIRSTSYAESSMKLKSATPKTNAGYIQGVAIGPRFFSGGGQNAANTAPMIAAASSTPWFISVVAGST
jgi:hypothetical protein